MVETGAKAALCRAVADLARELPKLGAAEACARLGRLRRQATAGGFAPAAALAEGLGAAIGRNPRDTLVGPWLDALALAAGCGQGDADTVPLLMATVGVRYAA